jgi:hypothetical protein
LFSSSPQLFAVLELKEQISMTIQELELKLKEIDENIVINDLSKFNVTDIVEVAYNNNGQMINICACPSSEVREEIDVTYKDEYGRRHRTSGEVLAIANNFINQWRNEEGFQELMTCDPSKL